MFNDIFSLIIETLSGLYLVIILMRFILQLSRADFYNPISQFIVKATNPLLLPIRKVIPGFGGIDVASLILALLFMMLIYTIKALVLAGAIINPINLVAISAVHILGVFLKIYFWTLIVMIISSWVAPGSGHPILVLVNQIAEPLMKPFRNLLPPMGGLDLSPILVFLVLQVVAVVVAHLSHAVGISFSLI